MSSEPAISVHNLSKVYDLGLTGRRNSVATILKERYRHPIRGTGHKRERFAALDDLTFDVAEGEVVGVIGKNGAGKSTLLKILSRITPPSAGYIEMAGTIGSLLEVGTGFHPELTGLENVYLNGLILGMSNKEIDTRLEEIVDFAEVHKFLDTPVKRYSSGMRVRLAFAVAAHLEPEILIIDEVLSVGDYSFQAKCLEKMRAIASEDGRTVLYVSHNLVTVENLCSRTLLLIDGKLDYDGETSEAVTKYLNLFPRAEAGDHPGVFNLASADRSGADCQMEVLKRLELRPNGGHPSDTIRPGERLQMEITVDGLSTVPSADVHVSVIASGGETLFRMSSHMVPLEAAHARCNEETIVIDIPSVPLTPGEYWVCIVIRDSNFDKLDEVYRAAEFTVAPGDYFGTGYHFAARDGKFVVPWEWEVRPSVESRVASG